MYVCNGVCAVASVSLSVRVCVGGTEHRAEKAPGCVEGMGLLGGMFSEDAVTCDWDEAVCGTGPGKPCALREAWGTKAPPADELTKMAPLAGGMGGLGQGCVERTLSGPRLPLEASPGACMLACVCVHPSACLWECVYLPFCPHVPLPPHTCVCAPCTGRSHTSLHS